MANINIRRDGGSTPSTPARGEPYQMLRDLLRWDPFREMTSFFPATTGATFELAFDVKETPTGYELRADVPGMKESDVDVSVTGNRLTIKGKREAEKKDESDTYYVYERSFGSFMRSFTLPEGADVSKVNAALKDGVLVIDIGKMPETQPKKIPVQAAAKQ